MVSRLAKELMTALLSLAFRLDASWAVRLSKVVFVSWFISGAAAEVESVVVAVESFPLAWLGLFPPLQLQSVMAAAARAIKNSSKQDDNVLDFFGGSGSTLIACEQLDRNCFMMELDPHYVDVIIARWEKFTGQKAVLLNGNS